MVLIRALVCLGLCGLVGCITTAQTDPKHSPTDSQLRDVARATLSAEADRDRQRLVKAELDQFSEKTISFSANDLGKEDQLLLAVLMQAITLVDELNMLQSHPKMLEFKAQVLRDGAEVDRLLFLRNQSPWCLGNDDVRCNTLRSMPPRQSISSLWPTDLAAAELAGQQDKAVLSPFTLVRRKGKRLVATPYVDDPLFGPKIKKLSAVLRHAAKLATEPTLKKFLKSRAKALVSRDPLPFDDSDLDWINLTGPWEVTVGPYETYRSPHKVKARYAMYIGMEDQAVTGQLTEFRKNLQTWENRLARLVGRRLYKPRKVDPKTAIRAVQVIASAGDARRARGAVVSYHLPNRGKAIQQGLSKKVMMINNMRAFTPIVKRRTEVVLDPLQALFVTEEAIILNSTFHEFCHGFGAYDDLEIENKQGKTTVAKALGDLAQVFEELKADVLSLWLVGEMRLRRKLTTEQLKQRYTTALIHMLGILQYDPRATHTQAAALLLGQLMETKAVVYDEPKNKWTIQYTQMRRAMKQIAKKVATLQLTGDRAGAQKLFDTYLKREGTKVKLVESLDRPRLKTKEAWLNAGIKGICLVYKATDLPPPPKSRRPKPKPKPKAKPPKPKAVDKPLKPKPKAAGKPPKPKAAGKPPKPKAAGKPPKPKAKAVGKPPKPKVQPKPAGKPPKAQPKKVGKPPKPAKKAKPPKPDKKAKPPKRDKKAKPPKPDKGKGKGKGK